MSNYVSNMLSFRKTEIDEIFKDTSYTFFDQTSDKEIREIFYSNFNLIIMNIIENEDTENNTIKKIKKIYHINGNSKKGKVIVINPEITEKILKISNDIYVFKNIDILKENSALIKKYIYKNLQKNNEDTSNITPSDHNYVDNKFVNNEQTSLTDKVNQESAIKLKDKENINNTRYAIRKFTNIAIESSYIFIDDGDIENEGNFCSPIDISNYPSNIKTKKFYNRYSLTNHFLEELNKKKKKIVIWKPYENRSTLHIIINFAVFLAKLGLDVAVIEALTRDEELFDRLLHYTNVPKNWHHFMESAFHPESLSNTDKIKWRWKNVDWYPITSKINSNGIEWYHKDLDILMSILDNYDFSFIYIPQITGIPIQPFNVEILYTMKYANELWIFADSFFKNSIANKEYIHDLQNSYNIDRTFLIFTNCFNKREAIQLSESIEIPLMATFPIIDHLIHLNNRKKSKLLIEDEDIFEILVPEFYKMREHYPEYQSTWEKIEDSRRIFSYKQEINRNKLMKKFFKLKN